MVSKLIWKYYRKNCQNNSATSKCYNCSKIAKCIGNCHIAADSSCNNSDKRLIDVSLKQFGDSVVIHIWNYYEGNIVFEDELPVRDVGSAGTGYGIKSIKLLVDKFEGALNTNTENDIFHLNIILPLKS
ncbi:GHKL domain-containing protein [Butyrivibrio sp. AE3009]|uniref:GHKL domain-containing protein n=1 Tax=Butyrivibrio sp. AE3009 TaxID=1280666 RepID=UPI0009DB7EC8